MAGRVGNHCGRKERFLTHDCRCIHEGWGAVSPALGSIDHKLTHMNRASAYSYSLAYVRSLPATSDEGKAAAVDAIAAALRLPSVFDFDPLFKLDAVVASKDHELFSLLQVFLNGGLSDFNNWLQGHAGAIEKYSSRSLQSSPFMFC